MARPVLKSLLSPAMALIPRQYLTIKGRGGGGVPWPSAAQGQKGRAGAGSSLGNWACPTSLPEELADDKDLGAKCSPGGWAEGWGGSITTVFPRK